LHAKGELPRDTLQGIEEAQQAILAFEPATEGQKIIQARVMQAYNDLLETHWVRLQAVIDTACRSNCGSSSSCSARWPSRRAFCCGSTASRRTR
jgi:hypothetical protein